MAGVKRLAKKYRVLWADPGSYGRFDDVEAASEGEAAWKVAIGCDAGTFKGIFPIPAAED